MIADKRDFLGGLLLIAGGLFIAIYAYANYTLGTLQRMGPGMFPFGAGLIMALLGVLVIIPAFLRSDGQGWGKVPFRSLACILISIVGFALVIPRFGLAPAIFVLVLVSSLADRRFNLLHAAAVAAVMTIVSYLVFILGLNLPLTLFRWSL